MIDFTGNAAARRAIEAAHAERGRMTRKIWNLLFGRG